MDALRVLILCTGNSCRSQMAEAFMRQLRPGWEVCSAGTFPATEVHPLAIKVMAEVGLDISRHRPKSVEQFVSQPFDHVITVCDDAREDCPVFTGRVTHRRHLGFPDPAQATGTDDEVLTGFRQVRNAIRERFGTLVGELGA